MKGVSKRKYRPVDWERRSDEPLLQRLPLKEGQRLVRVYVEGYDDVAFWRGIFDDFESDRLTFEISVPPRPDLAKGKKVLLGMLPESNEESVLCVDSDFDYLFDGATEQSRLVNSSQFMFHTYTYATENYLCYGPSLHNVCAKATKNDTRIFDFESFLIAYSRIIYPLFLWYAYSARLGSESRYTLLDFKNSVKINYLEVENGGEATLEWLRRQVKRRLASLQQAHPESVKEIEDFGRQLRHKALFPENTYLFMHGHTLMDNVVMVMLNAVCDKLKQISGYNISQSIRRGVSLGNEVSNYRNAVRSVRDMLLSNEGYKECFLYKQLRDDLRRYTLNATREQRRSEK